MIGTYDGEDDGAAAFTSEIRKMDHKRLATEHQTRELTKLVVAAVGQENLEAAVQIHTEVDVAGMPRGHNLGVQPVFALELLLSNQASPTKHTPTWLLELAKSLRPKPKPVAIALDAGLEVPAAAVVTPLVETGADKLLDQALADDELPELGADGEALPPPQKPPDDAPPPAPTAPSSPSSPGKRKR